MSTPDLFDGSFAGAGAVSDESAGVQTHFGFIRADIKDSADYVVDYRLFVAFGLLWSSWGGIWMHGGVSALVLGE